MEALRISGWNDQRSPLIRPSLCRVPGGIGNGTATLCDDLTENTLLAMNIITLQPEPAIRRAFSGQ